MTEDKKDIDISQKLNLSDLLESAEKIESVENKGTYKEATSNLKFGTQLKQQIELEENSKNSQKSIIENQKQQLTQNYLNERNIELLLRIIIAGIFVWIITSQLKKINIIIESIGKGTLKYDVAVISIYITGVFGQLITLAVIIFNNLFPSDNNKNQVELIKSILGKIDVNNHKTE